MHRLGWTKVSAEFWVSLVALGLEKPVNGARDVDAELERAVALGQRLDTSKVLVGLCGDHGVAEAVSPLAAGRRTLDLQSTLLPVMQQLDEVTRRLQRDFAEQQKEKEGDAERPADAEQGLWLVAQRDREELVERNAELRQMLEDERVSFEKEIARLEGMCPSRHHRPPLSPRRQRKETPNGEHELADSERTSQEGSSVFTDTEVVFMAHAQAEMKVDTLKKQVTDQRIRTSTATHRASAANRDKEDMLKRYSISHQKVKALKERQAEIMRRAAVLEAEVAELSEIQSANF